MSGELTVRDVIVQQLADHLLASAQAPVVQRWAAERYARAVLASGLVVPTGDVLNLAQEWQDDVEERRKWAGAYEDLMDCAAELRALTQQEPR